MINDEEDTYTYKWGFCKLGSTYGGYGKCSHEQAHISYQVYFDHTTAGSHRECVVQDNTDIVAQKVCQQETNQKIPAWVSETGVASTYWYDGKEK